ncbi:hypothetical protein TIFTF001_043310 [Ficus carica]|uniref:Uncharacterized protein n=1 Tax=Ficus carica TaxID=3494 RepID=A0AA87ZB65_FICCA|nr:hypothetical protein TIFTF001_043310 [Ficus carica]
MPNDTGGLCLPEGCLFGTTSTLSPVLLNDTVRRSFAYHKLPRQLLKLCVLKLDGSFFGHKLINDKAYIRLFGIKDGDQLKFVQHLSVNCEREKRRVTRHRSFNPYDHEHVMPWN